ncbi:MAG: hypothetical protein CMJ59_20120 [Planctomycetaceae bacterium]|nr:hypothetical protein [Planctomycetaceae bacterium]
MVNIFTRKITDELTSLVKQMDSVVGKNRKGRMAGFVVLLTDDPDEAEEQLVAFAKKHKIKNLPLTVFDGLAGPPAYKIAKDAEVTVLMWKRARVQANHAYQAGKLNAKEVKLVLGSTKKILP